MKKKTAYESVTFRRKSACGWVYLICMHKDNNLVRIEIEMGKSGTCANSVMSGITSLINEILFLRNKHKGNVKTEYIIEGLKGIECHKKSCCVDIISKLLDEWREKYEDSKES